MSTVGPIDKKLGDTEEQPEQVKGQTEAHRPGESIVLPLVPQLQVLDDPNRRVRAQPAGAERDVRECE